MELSFAESGFVVTRTWGRCLACGVGGVGTRCSSRCCCADNGASTDESEKRPVFCLVVNVDPS